MLYLATLFIVNLLIILKHETFSNIINIYDTPDNKRKIHKHKISLSGGIIIFINITIFSLFNYFENFELISDQIFLSNNELYLFFFGASSFFLIGIFDDKYNISANKKIILIIFVLCILMNFDKNLIINSARLSFTNYEFKFGNISFMWTLICFLLFINAFNMIDGINLQSGIYSIVIILIIMTLGHELLFFLSILTPLLFFLYLNYKNKSFLGNSGSYLLPFIFSYYLIKFYNYDQSITADFIVLIMIIPGLDLIRLFFIRIINKRNPCKADNNHLHHILLKRNSYLRTLLIIQSIIIFPIILKYFTNNIVIPLIFSVGLYYYFLLKKN